VIFQLGFPELSFWNAKSEEVVEPARYTVWVGGSSKADQQAAFEIAP
jgi:beta-glucosidase